MTYNYFIADWLRDHDGAPMTRNYMLHDGAPIDETDPVYVAEVALWHARLEAMDPDNGRTAAQSARIVLAAARNLRSAQAAAPAKGES
jgi:hypothetical protein